MKVIENKTYTNDKIEDWLKRLPTVYNRGFWSGYYLGHKLGEWTNSPGSISTEKKIYIGKGSKYYPKINAAEFIIEAGNVKPGDTLMVTGSHCGMAKTKMATLIVNGRENEKAVKGDKITFPFTEKITSQDKLYKIVEAVNGKNYSLSE